MNREIKFRAWDKDERVIRTVLGLSLFHGAVSVDIGNGKYLQDDTERFELMQYTGLFDNSGTEIYEGDIIQFSDWPNKVIAYKDVYFAGFSLKGTDLFLSEFDAQRMKVIGNIFENPELLF